MRSCGNRPVRSWSRPTRPRGSLAGIVALLLVASALLLPARWVSGDGPVSPGVQTALPTGAARILPDAPPLAIASFTSSLPAMHQGESTYLNVTATGGAPPYTYWFDGLPLGCRSQNASSIRCYPIEAERFTITVFVNDTVGTSVNATLVLPVTSGYGGPPFIHYFYASPATAAILTQVLLYANATSNSSTPSQNLKFSYLDLPPGCAGFNQTVLQCVPTAPGDYHLYLLVTDGFGAFATARTWLNVTGGNASDSSTPVLSKPMQEGLAIAGVGLLIVVAAIFLIPRARKPRSGPPVQPWEP